jgi:hypothetical protein
MQKVKRLMGCLVFYHALETSCYKDLFQPIRWFEVGELFIKSSAALSGLPLESPLLVSVDVSDDAFNPRFGPLGWAPLLATENEFDADGVDGVDVVDVRAAITTGLIFGFALADVDYT